MKRAALLMLFTLAGGAPLAEAAEPGIAKGDLVIEGKHIHLSHAYALERDNEEGMMDGTELRILLTDVDVPDAAKLLGRLVPSFGPLGERAHAGALKGVLIKLDPAKPNEALYATILDQTPPGESFATVTRVPAPFERFAVANGRVTGAGDLGAYQGTFDAPLEKIAPVTSHLKGPEAAASAPAKAFIATEQAMRKGDMATAQKGMTAGRWRMIDAFVKQAGAAEFAKQAAQVFPDAATRASQIRDAILRADGAYLIVDEEGGKLAVPLALEGGQWKVDE